MERRIQPEQAAIGMYVAGFGGSWLSHPFWRAKFVIDTERALERVQQAAVPYVLIDDERGLAPTHHEDTTEVEPVSDPAPEIEVPEDELRHWHIAGSKPPPDSRAKAEMQCAKALVNKSKNVMRSTFADVRLGRALKFEKVSAVVDDVVESVELNPDVLLKVVGLKKKSEYTYMHSVAVCALMVNMARHLRKNNTQTRSYGLAGLLHDLGKVGIPESILNDEGSLTDEEFEQVRKHPKYGHDLLSQMPEITGSALDVCLHHHERMDGTGYPFGLSGDEISEVARLGAICDVYDALTSDRAYKRAWTPSEALAEMWKWEGHFDRALLFKFMQSIDIFAPGMLVRMHSNRLAVVLSPKTRNQPLRVRAFYEAREKSWIEPVEFTISDNVENDLIVDFADPADWGFDDWGDMAQRLMAGKPAT